LGRMNRNVYKCPSLYVLLSCQQNLFFEISKFKYISSLMCVCPVSDNFDVVTLEAVMKLRHENMLATDVSRLMVETFEARRTWIATRKPSLKCLMSNFPHLKDVLSNEVCLIINIIMIHGQKARRCPTNFSPPVSICFIHALDLIRRCICCGCHVH